METFESIALRHSARGMDILSEALGPGYITKAAEALLSEEKGTVLIATGFYVGGAAETDGPPGAWCVAKTLGALGFTPVIVTDALCSGIFEGSGIPAVYADMDLGEEDCLKLLEDLKPSCLISVERCGLNAKGFYGNASGQDIGRWTAPLSKLFEAASRRGYLTIGIGDGGNEIGMGSLRDLIEEKLDIIPCTTACDHLIAATTSNWGAYALCAALEKASGTACFPSAEDTAFFLAETVTKGLVNAGTKTPEFAVDGFPGKVGMQVIEDLHSLI
ncbi:MAG: DUF4392 domain-containing protein [Firmicutes bacterium]|nr:DUF4392 domain-containing protein [Bacillota bacterium]